MSLQNRRRIHVAAVALAAASIVGCGGGGGGSDGATQAAVVIHSLFAGGASNCRIDANTKGTMCWGMNDVGQLGTGSIGNVPTPTVVTFPGGRTASGIAQGAEHACAILSDKTVACWGSNSDGQIGLVPSTSQSNSPVLVDGIVGAKAVSVGLAHTCVVTGSDTVLCWGSNAKGQLGQPPGTLTHTHLPQTIPGVTAKALGSGFSHVCAAGLDSSVTCWGDNQYGQLGDASNTDSHTPVAVGGLTDVVALTTGAYHSCAANAGKTYCWGLNDTGQLGSSGSTNRNTPTETAALLSGSIQLVAGVTHTCALNASSAQCWGSNSSRQLSGSASGGTLPVSVSLTAAPRQLAAGLNHTCAQDAGNATWCWGAGDSGRLGPNAATDSGVPVRVP